MKKENVQIVFKKESSLANNKLVRLTDIYKNKIIHERWRNYIDSAIRAGVLNQNDLYKVKGAYYVMPNVYDNVQKYFNNQSERQKNKKIVEKTKKEELIKMASVCLFSGGDITSI